MLVLPCSGDIPPPCSPPLGCLPLPFPSAHLFLRCLLLLQPPNRLTPPPMPPSLSLPSQDSPIQHPTDPFLLLSSCGSSPPPPPYLVDISSHVPAAALSFPLDPSQEMLPRFQSLVPPGPTRYKKPAAEDPRARTRPGLKGETRGRQTLELPLGSGRSTGPLDNSEKGSRNPSPGTALSWRRTKGLLVFLVSTRVLPQASWVPSTC